MKHVADEAYNRLKKDRLLNFKIEEEARRFANVASPS
jgi:hypothetical protein